MPRVTIAPVTAPGSIADDGTIFTWTAADATNKNQAVLTGAEIILVRNTGAGARTFTITSVADALGRIEDVSDSLAAGEFRVYGPMKLDGWLQSDGKIYFEGSHAEIQIAVIKIPYL